MTDALITEEDVKEIPAAIDSKRLVEEVRTFLEGEPCLYELLGIRLEILYKALDRAGVSGEHRNNIVDKVHLLLGVHVYLLQKAMRRFLADLMPSESDMTETK
jgi:hypothetical protein